jgi:hypothetical protein
MVPRILASKLASLLYKAHNVGDNRYRFQRVDLTANLPHGLFSFFFSLPRSLRNCKKVIERFSILEYST